MRRVAILCLLAALGLVGAGCAGSANAVAPPPLETFSATASATRAAASARFEMKVEVAMGDQTAAMTGAGGFDQVTKRLAMDLDLSSFAKTFSALSGGSTPALEGFDDPDNWKLSAVQDGNVMYMRFPLLDPRLGGKHWVRVDLDALAGASGGTLGQFGAYGASDPRATLKLLEAVSGSIEPLGGESIRGTETSHYVAMVDPTKLAALAAENGASRDLLSGMTQSFAQLGLGVVPLHVWIDAEQRLRKLTMEISPATDSAMSGVKASVAFELYDYGAPVSIELPAAADVADGASLMR
ncbi:MAG: hypothetical protein U0R50_09835 [Gaiellales bacterium]